MQPLFRRRARDPAQQVRISFAAPASTAQPLRTARHLETMLERKLGSAVVTQGERVVGVFTTIDALRALHELLVRPGAMFTLTGSHRCE